MPVTSGFTKATAIMIGEKLADQIRKEHEISQPESKAHRVLTPAVQAEPPPPSPTSTQPTVSRPKIENFGKLDVPLDAFALTVKRGQQATAGSQATIDTQIVSTRAVGTGSTQAAGTGTTSTSNVQTTQGIGSTSAQGSGTINQPAASQPGPAEASPDQNIVSLLEQLLVSETQGNTQQSGTATQSSTSPSQQTTSGSSTFQTGTAQNNNPSINQGAQSTSVSSAQLTVSQSAVSSAGNTQTGSDPYPNPLEPNLAGANQQLPTDLMFGSGIGAGSTTSGQTQNAGSGAGLAGSSPFGDFLSDLLPGSAAGQGMLPNVLPSGIQQNAVTNTQVEQISMQGRQSGTSGQSPNDPTLVAVPNSALERNPPNVNPDISKMVNELLGGPDLFSMELPSANAPGGQSVAAAAPDMLMPNTITHTNNVDITMGDPMAGQNQNQGNLNAINPVPDTVKVRNEIHVGSANILHESQAPGSEQHAQIGMAVVPGKIFPNQNADPLASLQGGQSNTQSGANNFVNSAVNTQINQGNFAGTASNSNFMSGAHTGQGATGNNFGNAAAGAQGHQANMIGVADPPMSGQQGAASQPNQGNSIGVDFPPNFINQGNQPAVNNFGVNTFGTQANKGNTIGASNNNPVTSSQDHGTHAVGNNFGTNEASLNANQGTSMGAIDLQNLLMGTQGAGSEPGVNSAGANAVASQSNQGNTIGSSDPLAFLMGAQGPGSQQSVLNNVGGNSGANAATVQSNQGNTIGGPDPLAFLMDAQGPGAVQPIVDSFGFNAAGAQANQGNSVGVTGQHSSMTGTQASGSAQPNTGINTASAHSGSTNSIGANDPLGFLNFDSIQPAANNFGNTATGTSANQMFGGNQQGQNTAATGTNVNNAQPRAEVTFTNHINVNANSFQEPLQTNNIGGANNFNTGTNANNIQNTAAGNGFTMDNFLSGHNSMGGSAGSQPSIPNNLITPQGTETVEMMSFNTNKQISVQPGQISHGVESNFFIPDAGASPGGMDMNMDPFGSIMNTNEISANIFVPDPPPAEGPNVGNNIIQNIPAATNPGIGNNFMQAGSNQVNTNSVFQNNLGTNVEPLNQQGTVNTVNAGSTGLSGSISGTTGNSGIGTGTAGTSGTQAGTVGNSGGPVAADRLQWMFP